MIPTIGNIGFVKKENLDGKYQAATLINNPYVYISSDFGKTWVQAFYNEIYASVAISGDGKYVTAIMTNGYIRPSSDFGISAGGYGSYSAWKSIDMSYDGKYQLAVANNYVLLSTNYGVTWSQKIYGESAERGAVSADGSIQMITGGGGSDYVNISTNYGSTFSRWMVGGTYFQHGNYASIDISGDGAVKVFAKRDSGNRLDINGGTGSFYPPYTGGPGVGVSHTGQYVSAVFSGNYLYKSTDYGATFTPDYNVNGDWRGIAMSASGKYQTRVRQNNLIMRSENFGVSWSQLSGTSRDYGSVYVGKSL